MIKTLQKLLDKITTKLDLPVPVFNKQAIIEINLIRCRLKEEFGEAPDLQDPKLLEELIDCAFLSKNAMNRSQIRKLMDTLGEPWKSLYSESNQRRIDQSDVLK